MAKYLLIGAAILSLATVGIGVVNKGKLDETKGSLDQAQSALATQTKENNNLKGELATAKTSLEAATTKGDQAANAAAALQSELDTAKQQLTTANNSVSERDAQIQTLTQEVEKLRNDLVNQGTQSTAAAPVADDPRIKELEALVQSQSEEIRSAKAQLADVQKREADRAKGLMQPGLEGRILAVNPAWNFVVLSIGDKQGVVNNAELLIKRGGQYLGKVRVTSVEPATSIADIVANTLPPGVSVQPGDSVIYQQSRN